MEIILFTSSQCQSSLRHLVGKTFNTRRLWRSTNSSTFWGSWVYDWWVLVMCCYKTGTKILVSEAVYIGIFCDVLLAFYLQPWTTSRTKRSLFMETNLSNKQNTSNCQTWRHQNHPRMIWKRGIAALAQRQTWNLGYIMHRQNMAGLLWFSSWWLSQPICKILLKLNHFPRFSGKNENSFEIASHVTNL